jgi:hypothetical protein
MASALLSRLPSRQRSYVDGLWILFVVVQILDGVLTYIGVRTFGIGIEGNPLVAWYAQAFGPAAGLAAAKLFAIGCASILYLTARRGAVAILTVVYIVFAIAPWAVLLGHQIV